MNQHDNIDIGGNGVGFGSVSLERRPPRKCRCPWQHKLHSLVIDRWHHPITNGDIGADVTNPQRCRVERVAHHTAPPAI